jgi:hypothetical protein
MKVLATFLDSLIFSTIINMECTYSVECTSPVSLVITFHVIFTLSLDSAVSLLYCCLLASFKILLFVAAYMYETGHHNLICHLLGKI